VNLESCEPLLVSEEKTTLLVDDRVGHFLLLLDITQVADDLLHTTLSRVSMEIVTC
jgi:hypothetical protein